MRLTPVQKSVIERVLNAFETGSADGDYANISIFRDGPHRIRQITYGRSQTTEYGNLRELVKLYVEASGQFSAQLAPFVSQIGQVPLVDNNEFKNLLRRAGREDPIMHSVQNSFFDQRYFKPALTWAEDNGFTEALSMLVIYDSFVHSGGILDFLRSRFPESPPARGGNERIWISQYVGVRQIWLANHANPELHPTVYRTECFKREIGRGNWDLARLPIDANSVQVRPAAGLVSGFVPAKATKSLTPVSEGVVPFIGDATNTATAGSDMPGLRPRKIISAVAKKKRAANKATATGDEGSDKKSDRAAAVAFSLLVAKPGQIPSSGFCITINRIREEERAGIGFPRTISNYLCYWNGKALPELAGQMVERQGPGDNTSTGVRRHTRIAAGAYRLRIQSGERYKTYGYAARGEPLPGLALDDADTGARSAILIHPCHDSDNGYLSSIGCLNPAIGLTNASSHIRLTDSRARVIAIIDGMKTVMGADFPRVGRIPGATVIITGEP